MGGALALLLALGFVGLLLWTRTRAAALSRALDDEVASFRAITWRRPPPREVVPAAGADASEDGNAADAQRAALIALGPLDATLSGEIGRALRGEIPVTAAMESMVRAHAAGIAALRESVRRPYAHSAFVCDPTGRASENYRAQLNAVRSVLLLGELAGGGECLRACEDAVRLGQDMVPGNSLLRLMVSAAETEMAVSVAVRCAKTASLEDIRASARAFERIAQTPPSLGEAYEAEFLGITCLFRGIYRSAPLLPGVGHGLTESRPVLVAGWDLLARDLPGWRRVRSDDYPAAFDAVRARTIEIESSRNPTVRATLATYDRFVDRDAAAQARVRALTVILSALADSTGAPPADPPPAASRPALRDPFTGTPLRSIHGPDGTLTVLARGVDRRDDNGAPGSDDVVVTFSPRGSP